MPGKGRLRLTGRLGDVMRESAHAALAHLRIEPERYGADPSRLACDVHVHVPEAATAKDGPSAGTALFAALLSAVTRVPVRADVALTGEISLTGRVLPVGGVRPKLLAAERAGVRRVVLPEENLADVPPDLSIEVVAVRSLEEVVAAAFHELPGSRSRSHSASSAREEPSDDESTDDER
jgi:ATP-dependent Lon protease